MFCSRILRLVNHPKTFRIRGIIREPSILLPSTPMLNKKVPKGTKLGRLLQGTKLFLAMLKKPILKSIVSSNQEVQGCIFFCQKHLSFGSLLTRSFDLGLPSLSRCKTAKPHLKVLSISGLRGPPALLRTAGFGAGSFRKMSSASSRWVGAEIRAGLEWLGLKVESQV